MVTASSLNLQTGGGTAVCLSTKAGSRPTDNFILRAIPKANPIANVNPSGNGMNGLVFDVEALSPNLTTNKGEGIKVAGRLDMKGADQIKRVYETGGGKSCPNNDARWLARAEDTSKGYP